MRTPRSAALQAFAISAAVRLPLAIAVNRSRSTAAFKAKARWYPWIVLNIWTGLGGVAGICWADIWGKPSLNHSNCLPDFQRCRHGLYNTTLSAPKFFLKYTAWLAALKTLGAW